MVTVEDTNMKPDHNSLGRGAFIVGLIAMIMSFIPIIGLVAWLLAPLAILFGLIALRKAPRSMAIAGIITGAIALFICISWVKGVQSVGQAMNKDTFNGTGETVDLSAAPIMDASIRVLWKDLEDNKIAAGKKYAGHRLMFKNEVINEFGGDVANPRISFIGKNAEFMSPLVSASFVAADGEKVGTLKKGGKVSFLCEEVRETIGDGYSLGKCSLK